MTRTLGGTLLCVALAACTGAPATADLIIAGGQVHDGSAAAAVVADVVVVGDRIVHVGPDAHLRFDAARTIDARDRIVAPGFIDPHTHPDRYIRAADAAKRLNAPWLFQGVTTLFIGGDGGGTPDVAADRAWFERHGVGTNLAAYVGFGAVRTRVIGRDDRAPDAGELARMRALVANAMCEGAFGLSTGLFYAPQSFATTDEVVALAREAARRGGRYDTHHRDESSYGLGLMDSLREVLEIGRRAGLPVHIAHIKALGTDVRGSADAVIAMIDAARADGQAVSADQYPWLASGTQLGAAVLPRWAVDGGRATLLRRLEDASIRARIRAEMAENLRRRGGADTLLLVSENQEWTGRTLGEMARAWDLDPRDAALRVIASGGLRDGGMPSPERIASFNMDEDDVERFMRQPWVLTSSDGSDGHPRQYASFSQKYARYVRERGTLTLEEFIHRSTGLTADTLGLEERGYLRAGYHADVVVIDPERFAPRADYVHPRRLSVGVEHALVNGTPAIADGRLTGAAPGRVLRHRPPAGTCPTPTGTPE